MKPLRRYVLLSCASLLLAGLVMEIYLRAFSGDEFLPPSRILAEKYPYSVTHFGGTIHRYGPRVLKPSDTRLRELEFPINSLGFRGAETTFQKSPGVIRIAVYGGSSVFDVTATRREDWPSLLEVELRKRGLQVEVLNFGVPGMPVYDSALRLMTEGARFHPDVVLLSSIWNDLAYLHTKSPLVRIPRPQRLAGLLHHQGFLDWLLSEHSHFFARIRLNYFVLRQLRKGDGAVPLEDGPLAAPVSAPTAEGLEAYRQSVKLFADVARNIGAKPVLMAEPSLIGEKTTPEQWRTVGQEFSAQFTRQGIASSFLQARAVLEGAAREKKVPYFDFSPELDQSSENFLDHVHLKDSGRRKLLQLLVQKLVPLLSAKSLN